MYVHVDWKDLYRDEIKELLATQKREIMDKVVEEERKKYIEALAEYFYNLMPYDGEGKKPSWVEHGNSIKQGEARQEAIKVLEAITNQTEE